MATYAMIEGNSVSNIIVADDKDATESALNCTLVAITSETPAGIGWTYDGATFIAPPLEEV